MLDLSLLHQQGRTNQQAVRVLGRKQETFADHTIRFLGPPGGVERLAMRATMSAQRPDSVLVAELGILKTIMSSKGYSAVGLNEILTAAGVPKGSFYHYFSSKEAFGEALLQRYFDRYLASMDSLLGQDNLKGAARLMSYWDDWLVTQTSCGPQSKCLVVKLAAEVADLSERMRGILLNGTTQILDRLTRAINVGVADGSLVIDDEPSTLAETLYQSWLGASLLAKLTRDDAPLKAAMTATRRMLKLDDKA